MNIEQDIKDAIHKNMPAMQAEVLQKYLTAAAYDAEQVLSLQANVKLLQDKISELTNQLRSDSQRQADLDKAQSLLQEAAKKEKDATDALVQSKVVVAEAKFEVLNNVMTTLFRNQQIQTTTLTQVPVVNTYSTQHNGGQVGANSNTTMTPVTSTVTQESI